MRAVLFSWESYYTDTIKDALQSVGVSVDVYLFKHYRGIQNADDFFDHLFIQGYKVGSAYDIGIIDVPAESVQGMLTDLCVSAGCVSVYISPPVFVESVRDDLNIFYFEPLLSRVSYLFGSSLDFVFNEPFVNPDSITARIKLIIEYCMADRVLDLRFKKHQTGGYDCTAVTQKGDTVNFRGQCFPPYGVMHPDKDLIVVNDKDIIDTIFNPMSIANKPVFV